MQSSFSFEVKPHVSDEMGLRRYRWCLKEQARQRCRPLSPTQRGAKPPGPERKRCDARFNEAGSGLEDPTLPLCWAG